VWIADTAADFTAAIERLLADDTLRRTLALNARRYAEQHFDWSRLGVLQRRLWNEMLAGDSGVTVRPGIRTDLPAITHIQDVSHGASRWRADSYFDFDVTVAERAGTLVGFMVTRITAPDEVEVLNIAVSPENRRQGVAVALLESLGSAEIFLEVRESNIGARALYEKLGFHVVGRREAYYDDPVETALVMRRPPLH
jgi:ribosomal-protein-alanine N-acetyltransferase